MALGPSVTGHAGWWAAETAACHRLVVSSLSPGTRGGEVVVRTSTAARFRMACYLMRISASWRRYLLVSSEAGLPSLEAFRRR